MEGAGLFYLGVVPERMNFSLRALKKENAIVEKCFSIIPGGPGIHVKIDFITNMRNVGQMLPFVPDNIMWFLSKAWLWKCCFINSGEGSLIVS